MCQRQAQSSQVKLFTNEVLLSQDTMIVAATTGAVINAVAVAPIVKTTIKAGKAMAAKRDTAVAVLTDERTIVVTAAAEVAVDLTAADRTVVVDLTAVNLEVNVIAVTNVEATETMEVAGVVATVAFVAEVATEDTPPEEMTVLLVVAVIVEAITAPKIADTAMAVEGTTTTGVAEAAAAMVDPEDTRAEDVEEVSERI